MYVFRNVISQARSNIFHSVKHFWRRIGAIVTDSGVIVTDSGVIVTDSGVIVAV